MEICRQLGERYLWVDRFRIIQDDEYDKKHQIFAMATIYSRAKFTIIATDGDSDTGIAGVGRDRFQAQTRTQISGIVTTPKDHRVQERTLL